MLNEAKSDLSEIPKTADGDEILQARMVAVVALACVLSLNGDRP
jgi:hypothetical protein